MRKYKYDVYYDRITEMHKSGMKAKDMLAELNDETLTVGKIYKIIYRLGLSNSSTKSQSKYNEIDIKAMELISSGMSHRETARQLGIDQQTMTLRLKKKYDIEVFPDGKKCVDSYYFNDINTEEKAYWLGMMYADGYVNENSGIELCLKDKEHVKKFKTALKSEHKVSDKVVTINGKEHKAYRICIKDNQLINDLTKQGCFRAKSFDIQFPTEAQVPKELIPAFIRGFFDGDGDISKTGNKNGYRIVGFTCANEKFLKDLANLIEKELNIVTKLAPTSGHYRLRIHSVTAAYQFLDFIYKDASIYLNRKYDLYKNFILPSLAETTED